MVVPSQGFGDDAVVIQKNDTAYLTLHAFKVASRIAKLSVAFLLKIMYFFSMKHPDQLYAYAVDQIFIQVGAIHVETLLEVKHSR